jgi:alpha-glucosidase
MALHNDINQFFMALEKFDPFFDPEPAAQENVHSFETEYITGQIVVRW